MEKIVFVSFIVTFVVINSVQIWGEISNHTNAIDESALGKSVQNNNYVIQPLPCIYIPGLVVGNRARELECCNEIETKYKSSWSKESLSLTRHLETLREWKCPQFHEQCRDRIFSFTTFTDLVYDYFCNYTALADRCLPILNATVRSLQSDVISYNYSNDDSLLNFNGHLVYEIVKEWKTLVLSIQSTQMTIDELLEPCIQVAQYEQEKLNDGGYQEVINFVIPFCPLTWCGFVSGVFQERDISTWTCLPSSCRTNIVILVVVMGLMALVITVVNILVIVVIFFDRRLQNGQSIYKISLGVADLLVGIVVLPTCIYNINVAVWTRFTTTPTRTAYGYKLLDQNTAKLVSANISKGIFENLIADNLGYGYINFVGVFTAISLFVSVYTLAGAGIDRLIAVYKPLAYRKRNPHKIAKITCVLCWLFAFIFSILPVFQPAKILFYGLAFSMVVVSLERAGVILYITVFLLPLVIVWVVNVLTFIVTKGQIARSNAMTDKTKQKRNNIEKRLAATLRLMVGVFSLNTLPLWIVFPLLLAIPNIDPNHPETLKSKAALNILSVAIVTLLMLFGNSFWNFFIYNIRNKDFRLALKMMFSNLSNKLGIDLCCVQTRSYFQSKAGQGRRKLSFIASSLNLNFQRKQSTSTITVAETNPSTSCDHIQASSRTKSNGEDTTMSKEETRKNIQCTSKSNFYFGSSTKEVEDSVFGSYAEVEINSFCHSVMRRIEDDIVEVDE